MIEPRKLWPSGLADQGHPGRKGRIAGCAEGRALAYADDPGWADLLLPLWARPGGGDGRAPQAVLDAVVGVLGRWRRRWEGRPVAVVPMPSLQHAALVGSVASHVATVGRLPLLDALQMTGPPPDADLASGARVAALLGAMALRPGVPVPAGPLLLVDATCRSGWSMTVAAALLREAGATAVLPLVLHQLP